MNIKHNGLAHGGWERLSLPEQLGNIGSEVSRAFIWYDRDRTLFYKAIERALELLDCTLSDSRWVVSHRLKEICRVRELLCDAVFGDNMFQTSLHDLDQYFLSFALLARAKR